MLIAFEQDVREAARELANVLRTADEEGVRAVPAGAGD